jgi:hypothetical protein
MPDTCTAYVLDGSSGSVPIVIDDGTTGTRLLGWPGAVGVVVPLSASRYHWPWMQVLLNPALAASTVVISAGGAQLAAQASAGDASVFWLVTLPHAVSTRARPVGATGGRADRTRGTLARHRRATRARHGRRRARCEPGDALGLRVRASGSA